MKYLFICYEWKRRKDYNWYVDYLVWEGSIVDWYIYIVLKYSHQEDKKLLSATEITEEDFTKYLEAGTRSTNQKGRNDNARI